MHVEATHDRLVGTETTSVRWSQVSETDDVSEMSQRYGKRSLARAQEMRLSSAKMRQRVASKTDNVNEMSVRPH